MSDGQKRLEPSESARPYAKAIFAIARDTKQLPEWDHALEILALIASEAQKYYILKNPKISKAHKMELFMQAAHDIAIKIDFPAAENLLRLLITQKKMLILPQIHCVYKEMMDAYQNIMPARIVSAYELSEEQTTRIKEALEKRFQATITLQCSIDLKLIGGAVIYVGDQVLDGSILGKLRRLKEEI